MTLQLNDYRSGRTVACNRELFEQLHDLLHTLGCDVRVLDDDTPFVPAHMAVEYATALRTAGVHVTTEPDTRSVGNVGPRLTGNANAEPSLLFPEVAVWLEQVMEFMTTTTGFFVSY